MAGTPSNRRITARDVLTELATTYRQTAIPLIEANKNWLLKELELLEFIEAMKRDHVRASLVEYLVQQSSNRPNIIKKGPTPSPNVCSMGGTIPRVKPSDKIY
jgi:hypothetical protein